MFEACRMPLDPEARAVGLLQGILHMTRADGAAVFHGEIAAGGNPVARRGKWAPRDTSGLAVGAIAQRERDADIVGFEYLAAHGLSDVDDDRTPTFYLCSRRASAGTRPVTLGVRRHGAPFTAAEAMLVRAVHESAVGTFLRYDPPAAAAAVAARPLPPRVRQVLAELRGGGSEKELAARLRISAHTVHIYVKQIYRHYRVNSRAELMRLWIDRPEVAP